jgi:hypothetical protein
MSKTVWCFLVGDRTSFSVDIDQTKTVDHLKEAITQKKRQRLADVDPDHLTLYRVEIDNEISRNRTSRINALTLQSLSLNEDVALDEEGQLSDIFGKTPEGKKEYILVKLSQGESIYPRWGAVADMILVP